MRPEERDPAYLWDMIEAARGVVEFTKNLTLQEFLGTGEDRRMTQLAVERELEIIGEAARRVSAHLRGEHSEIPWKELVGLRNVISHQYDKVDYAEIFRIAAERIPEVIALLEPLVPPAPRADEE